MPNNTERSNWTGVRQFLDRKDRLAYTLSGGVELGVIAHCGHTSELSITERRLVDVLIERADKTREHAADAGWRRYGSLCGGLGARGRSLVRAVGGRPRCMASPMTDTGCFATDSQPALLSSASWVRPCPQRDVTHRGCAPARGTSGCVPSPSRQRSNTCSHVGVEIFGGDR
jgi:hypothetical protein